MYASVHVPSLSTGVRELEAWPIDTEEEPTGGGTDSATGRVSLLLNVISSAIKDIYYVDTKKGVESLNTLLYCSYKSLKKIKIKKIIIKLDPQLC